MATKRKGEATKAPTEEEWDTHKHVLRELYFGSTLTKLMQCMEIQHGFIASKNQYERKLKEWEFRKNLSSDEWKYIIHKKRKREDLGKESQIMMHGVAIPKKRIKKEEGRHTLSDLNRISTSHPNAPSPETPEGICVSTPPSAIREDFIRATHIKNLPYFILRDLFTSQGGSNPFLIHQSKLPASIWSPERGCGQYPAS
ncbi:uncharacterized protein LY89DRAFT_451973 [Mollisia scopiformis]|uniref:Clr5 domain-containing protein n=1 Tax=Mollisia scopiformis TaxID=149040 RepID=A0A194XKL7_MOLSC|nr:uncharacterized protein LY89DRAFT_451973 [Mollisia scopiformis]KUJ20686.1 hypothetical protein LY89DRAFT_451973 [Mollisia scopiformis]